MNNFKTYIWSIGGLWRIKMNLEVMAMKEYYTLLQNWSLTNRYILMSYLEQPFFWGGVLILFKEFS